MGPCLLAWSSREALRRAPATLIFGLLASAGYGAMFSSTISVVMALPAFMVLALLRGLRPTEAPSRPRPNQGIVKSGYNALRFGLGVGLLTGAAFSLLVLPVLDALYGREALLAMNVKPGIPIFTGVTGAFGSMAAMTYGGIAFVMHWTLRLVTALTSPLPLRLQPFLDYAVERALLRKIGGGYIFAHRTLLDYFAASASGSPPRT